MMTQIKIPLLDSKTVLENIKNQKNPFWSQYHAYFSTWLGGITKDPALMLLPMGDHMVHRGDGVFEAIKTVNRKVFLLKEHLARLARSAASIGLKLPFEIEKIEDIILQTLKVADRDQTLIRLFVSRGPGSYTTNPYDPVGSQLYITITDLILPKASLYETGVRIGRSQIPVKESWMAQVKSCNYLPNVMMKKEALDRKLDFVVAFDRQNFLAESSTENIAILDVNGILVHPNFESILKGTTMIRTFELAKKNGLPIEQRNLRDSDIQQAQEVFMIGTTLDVLPVVQFENTLIGNGLPGPVSQHLNKLLKEEIDRGIAF